MSKTYTITCFEIAKKSKIYFLCCYNKNVCPIMYWNYFLITKLDWNLDIIALVSEIYLMQIFKRNHISFLKAGPGFVRLLTHEPLTLWIRSFKPSMMLNVRKARIVIYNRLHNQVTFEFTMSSRCRRQEIQSAHMRRSDSYTK